MHAGRKELRLTENRARERWSRGIACGLVVTSLTACTGLISGSGDKPNAGAGQSVPNAGGSTSALGSDRPETLTAFFAPQANKPRRLARLTRDQLQAVAQDLFNVTLTAGDLGLLPVGHATDPTIDPSQYVEGLWAYANTVAERALVPPGSLADFCNQQQLKDLPCAQAMVKSVGPLLLQRQLADAEVSAYSGYFTQASGLPGQEPMQAVVRAMLLAPGFVFPTEKAPVPVVEDHFRLSRLTLALWDSLPDAQTVTHFAPDAAAGRSSVIDALLGDPRAQRMLHNLGSQFADLDQLGDLAKVAPMDALFSADVQRATGDEVLKMLAVATTSSSVDSFSELLTTTKVWINELNAPLYGLTSSSPTFQLSESKTSEQRAGLLTAPGLLSIFAHSAEGSTVKRGVFVLQRLLCVPPPPPPPNVPPLASPDIGADATQRQRLAQHVSPACAGCHTEIDGVGQGLERYDAIGRYVETDHGQPLTSEGSFPITTDGPARAFTGAQELTKLLASSSQARECFVYQVHSALTDRDSYDSEKVALEQARAHFVASGDTHALVLELLTSPDTSARY